MYYTVGAIETQDKTMFTELAKMNDKFNWQEANW